MKRTSLLFFLFIFPFFSFAQQNQTAVSSYITEIERSDINNSNKETMLDELYQLLQHPCNLNTANDYQLSLIGLDALQRRNLKAYLKSSGQMFSIFELQLINGFSPDIIEQIKPFICIIPVEQQPSLRLDSIFLKAKHEFRMQYHNVLESSYGFLREDNKGYLGEKFATNLRYRLNYFDRLSFSFTADKDAGEPFFDSLQKYGYDFYSAQLTIKHLGCIKQLTVGDYRLNFGEGLVMGQFFDLGHFNTSATIKRQSKGIQPYNSITEYGFNRGLATQIHLNHFDAYVFGSYKTVDYSGSILTTGYHRTLTELAKKDSNTQIMLGVHLNYIAYGAEIGCTWIGYGYKYPVRHQTAAYQEDYFEGYYNNVASIDANYEYKSLRLFAEVAASQNKAFSSICGAEYTLGYKTNVAVSYRNYSKAFQNFYSSSIGIQSHNANEEGIYAAFSHRINRHIHYYVGFDLFHFPYISYRANESVKGYKAKAEIIFVPHEKHTFSLYGHIYNHPYNETHRNGRIYPEDNIFNQIQLNYRGHLTKYLSVDLRGGYSLTNTYTGSDTTAGMFSYIETSYTPLNERLKFVLRYTIFKTTDYYNHFNIYEYSLPLNFSTVSLYDEGQRIYTSFSFDITHHIQIAARYAITIYSNKEAFGIGNDKIKGNKRQDIAIQLRFR
ncbi:MAG: general secretion pathway protein GspK [Bacteroidales bacterium]|jgi:hypothetical protein|nr:general secretion pathway protein GspK [Bacteroidales bacterium]